MDDTLKEWRERWNNGDVKFVSELLDMAEKYERALGEINEYIPTRHFKEDIHNLKTIAGNALK